MNGPRKLYVKSFGCQMNVYDSHRMTDLLVPEGFIETTRVEDADLVILNTCHIREKAADKVYSELGRIRVLKQAAAQEGRRVTIAVAGCVAQAEGEEIIRRAPAVDLVVGPQNYHRLPGLLARAEREGAVVDTEFPVEDKFDLLKAPSREAIRARGISAFVTVQEGCDKFCTFCVVPYTRGAETSRPVTKIVAEVERLAGAGVRVNVVAPGTTDTGMLTRFTNTDQNKAALVSTVPVKRLAAPEEIAHVIAFVASANASYMTGASIPVDGGMIAD